MLQVQMGQMEVAGLSQLREWWSGGTRNQIDSDSPGQMARWRKMEVEGEKRWSKGTGRLVGRWRRWRRCRFSCFFCCGLQNLLAIPPHGYASLATGGLWGDDFDLVQND